MNINFNIIIKQITPFLIITIVAYAISTILYLYLPKSQNITIQNEQYNFEYKKYQVYNSFKEKADIKKKIIPIKKEIKKEYMLISNIALKAIYAQSNNNGWIIISEKNSSKTHILSIGDIFKNYELVSIYTKYVIFKKGLKEYKLTMKDDDFKNSVLNNIKKKTQKRINKIEENDSGFTVKRDLVERYVKTPAKIFKEISIKEIKKDGKIDGFLITNIQKKSIFNKLGLNKNDIIKSVNNIKLKSYNDAFKIYKQIDKIENLNFVILREGIEMEIDYEIK